MAFHDEVSFPGGIYWEGTDYNVRTDFSVQGGGTGEQGNPLVLTFHITTGTATFAVCGIPPKDLRNLGQWLVRMADEKQREAGEVVSSEDAPGNWVSAQEVTDATLDEILSGSTPKCVPDGDDGWNWIWIRCGDTTAAINYDPLFQCLRGGRFDKANMIYPTAMTAIQALADAVNRYKEKRDAK